MVFTRCGVCDPPLPGARPAVRAPPHLEAQVAVVGHRGAAAVAPAHLDPDEVLATMMLFVGEFTNEMLKTEGLADFIQGSLMLRYNQRQVG